MKKLILSLVVVSAVSFGMTSCKSEPATTETEATTVDTAAAAPEATMAAPADTAAAAPAADTTPQPAQ